MRRTFGINVHKCPVCQSTMVLLAFITSQAVIEKILTHVKVPREPIASGQALCFDVTDESVPGWAVGVDRAPVKTGRKKRMKEPYIEGVENHDDPESCVGARKGDGEALTGIMGV